MQKLFIPILLGTSRQGRFSEKPANLIFQQLKQRENIETVLIDPRNLNLPETDDGRNLAALNPEYMDMVKRMDGMIIVSPEYNHSFPGTLKRVLDMANTEYRKKAVLIAGVSNGEIGGARMIEALNTVLKTLGLSVTQYDLKFFKVNELFDETGNILDQTYLKKIERGIDDLIWMAQALKTAREKTSL